MDKKKKKKRERNPYKYTSTEYKWQRKKANEKKIQGTDVCVCVYFRLCRKVRM